MTARATVDDTARIADKLARLERAIQAGSSRARCLRLWSEFDRERDGHRCVDCHSTQRFDRSLMSITAEPGTRAPGGTKSVSAHSPSVAINTVEAPPNANVLCSGAMNSLRRKLRTKQCLAGCLAAMTLSWYPSRTRTSPRAAKYLSR
jgi:hypothetical protein